MDIFRPLIFPLLIVILIVFFLLFRPPKNRLVKILLLAFAVFILFIGMQGILSFYMNM